MPDIVLCRDCTTEFSVQDLPKPAFSNEQLRSGYIPNDVEASNLASTVEETDRELAQYDKKIQELEVPLNELKERRAKLGRYRDECQYILSPIRKLHTDILYEIFDLLLRQSVVGGLYIELYKVEPYTLNLSHVCSAWRQLIVSSPALWSSMYVDLNHRNWGADLVYLYLERSLEAPLTLGITASRADMVDGGESSVQELYNYKYPETMEEQSWYMLEMLLDKCRLWRHVTMQLSWNTFHELFDPVHYSLPTDAMSSLSFDSLETLDLDWNNRKPGLSLDSFLAPFTRAPHLRRLSTAEIQAWMPFPFPNISSFGPVKDWDNIHVVAFLKRCPRIQFFDISPGRLQKNSPAPEISPVKVAARSLSFQLEDSWHDPDGCHEQAARLLDMLTAENLTSLTIRMCYDATRWQKSMTDFMLRSQSPLEKLTLSGKMGTEDLLRLLTLLPSVTHLTIHAHKPHNIHNRFFEKLTIIPDSPIDPILPSLQSLNVRLDTSISSVDLLPDVTTIVTMVESRSQATGDVKSLQSFQSYFYVEQEPLEEDPYCLPDLETSARIQALVLAGMQVTVTVKKIGRYERWCL